MVACDMTWKASLNDADELLNRARDGSGKVHPRVWIEVRTGTR
jgi:hypothetical protein